jgi:predicted SAM-dependent methyltransferase
MPKILIKEILQDANYSVSENRGISLLKDKDLSVFCPGISTCGLAEIRMALENPARRIIATTIDREGYAATAKLIKQFDLANRITLKIEDLRSDFHLSDGSLDFIYARLVLHYLTDDELNVVLKKFYSSLQRGGRLFVVVRSEKDWETKLNGATFDQETGMTTYPLLDSNMKNTGQLLKRRFHTSSSLKNFLHAAGFRVTHIMEYEEQLYHDYLRTIKSPKLNSVLEALAEK